MTQELVDAKEIAERLNGNDMLFADKRVLISGAAGFLGQALVQFFLHLNESSLALTPVRLELLDNGGDLHLVEEYDRRGQTKNIRAHRVDITKPYQPEDHIDYIFHLASIASPYWYLRKPLETVDVNVWGTRNMLGIARAHGARMLYPSTSELYQTASEVPTSEDYVGAVPSMTPRSCYDVSKLAAETLCYIYGKNYGVHTAIIRIFNSFGPGLAQGDNRILAKLATAMKRGTKLAVYGNGQHRPTRTYCYVANTLYGMLLAALHGRSCEPYNIGADSPEVTVTELCQMVQRIFPEHSLDFELVRPPEVYTTEPERRCPDIRKARALLGYEPFVGLEDGLRRFLGWAMETYR